MNINYIDKIQDEPYSDDPSTFQAGDANQIKNAVNSKADLVNSTVPLTQLPPVYFSGVNGSGTHADPYIVNGSGGGSAEAYLKSLPGYEEGVEKILYGGITLSWGAIPSGNLEKLNAPILTIGSPAVDSFPLTWNVVTNATTYTLQRGSDESFADVATIYTGGNRQFTDSGLQADTNYFYRLRANASGFSPSNYATTSGKTLVTGNITPATPTAPITNDTLDTFNWTNVDGYNTVGSYEFTLDGGATYNQLNEKPLPVGNIVAPAGRIGVRVKADTGRNASGTLFNALPFTLQAVKAPTPTAPVTDDVNNTFNFTYSTGFNFISQYEYTVNSGNTYTQATEKPIFIGEFNKPIGSVGVRVRQSSGVIASDTLFNTVAFTENVAYENLITDWEVGDSIVKITGNTITYQGSQRARNNKVLGANTNGRLKATVSTFSAIGLGANDTSMAGRNEMHFGFTKEGNGKVTFFSQGSNLFESAPITGDATCEIVIDGASWIGLVNGTEIDRMTALAGSHRIHSFGDTGGVVSNIQQLGFV